MVDSKSFIGNMVEVKMDRPMGSKHPKHGFIYPVNYGYVPNTVSGDGSELDCYVLGVFEPLDTYKGKCIAVIHRTNDNDDKLVIVPENKVYSDDAIRALTEFQERYFQIKKLSFLFIWRTLKQLDIFLWNFFFLRYYNTNSNLSFTSSLEIKKINYNLCK